MRNSECGLWNKRCRYLVLVFRLEVLIEVTIQFQHRLNAEAQSSLRDRKTQNLRVPSASAFLSKVAFLLLVFHATFVVVVDGAALSFGGGCQEHLLDDFGQCRST